jgi:anti-sigma factor RsiW
MNCREFRLLLHALMDGELDLVRSLDVEQHLKTCTACAAENKNLMGLRSALRSPQLTYSAPQSLRKQLRQMTRPTEEKPTPFRTVWLWQWLTAGATALALVAFLLRPSGITDRDQLADELVSNHVRSLMVSHLTDVVSSDQHTVKPWFNGKLDFAPEVKDFAAEGFPLVGGRLDYLDGRGVAALVYQRNKHFINVFVWPVDVSGSNQPPAESFHGYNLINRDLNGLHYSFVSDLNAGELGQLADLMGKQ